MSSLASSQPLRVPENSRQALCFPLPKTEKPAETPTQILSNLLWNPDSAARSAAIMNEFLREDAIPRTILKYLSESEAVSISRIFACLFCAEESAVHVFHEEGKRMAAEDRTQDYIKLMRIASEERVHDWLLRRVRAGLPSADDLDSIRSRSRRALMKLASRDSATHFALISGMDSGVCILATALLQSERIASTPGLDRLIRHIRRDESGHVRTARDHAVQRGFRLRNFSRAYDQTKQTLGELFHPVSNAFEILGVDVDRLNRRILEFGIGGAA